jgi:hypothetical protein
MAVENLISGPYMVEGHLIVLSKFVSFNSTSLDRSAPIIRVIVYHAAARCSIACQWGVSLKLILGEDQGMRRCGIRCSSSHKFSVTSLVPEALYSTVSRQHQQHTLLTPHPSDSSIINTFTAIPQVPKTLLLPMQHLMR